MDEIYMAATQLITRSGGWPNSVFLTPDLQPFFAGTYFPPTDARGRPGLPRVLQGLREAWLFRRPELRPAGRDGGPGDAGAPRLGRRARRGPPRRRARGRRAGGARGPLRPRVGRLRAGPEVPFAREPLLPARARRRRRGARDAGHDARPHGPRRPDGPAGRRLPPVLDGRSVARAALREDALRQRVARLALRRGLGARAGGGLRPGGALHPRLRAARDDGSRGRLPLGHRRRDGRARGRLLHVDGRGAGGRPARSRGAALPRGVRPRGPAALRGRALRAVPAHPARRAGARGRALGSRPDAAARAGPARARRGPLAPRAPGHRRQGARRLERPDDRRDGARGGAPRRAPLHRGGRARRRLRALADGGRGGGHAAPRLPRRQGARSGLPRRLRVPRGGAPPAARGDGGRAVAERGGAPG